jgi:hypothetical protein
MSGEASGEVDQSRVSPEVAKVLDTIMQTRAARFEGRHENTPSSSPRELRGYRQLLIEIARLKGEGQAVEPDIIKQPPAEDSAPNLPIEFAVDLARGILKEPLFRRWTAENSPMTQAESDMVVEQLRAVVKDAELGRQARAKHEIVAGSFPAISERRPLAGSGKPQAPLSPYAASLARGK